jgi:pimeloyl-ACP methyl ester carboxylesterase
MSIYQEMNSVPYTFSPIPYLDLGGDGGPLHFLHANGYPPECYQPLLELLQTHYHVFGMLLRPLWKDSNPNDIRDWKLLSEDLLQFLAPPQPAPVLGVGHSIGAVVTLRAALRDPRKFRALVLIDPVLFVPSFQLGWILARAAGLGDRIHPLIAGAKKRRRIFDDLETMYRRYRNRNIFRYMSDESLRAYIDGITKPKVDGGHEASPQGGYELVYSPEWEAQIYRTGLHDFDIWRELPKFQVPTLFIRGAETDTFLEKAAKLVKRKQPKVWVETLDKSTHLLPLERPKEVFDIMQSFLKTLESDSSLSNH